MIVTPIFPIEDGKRLDANNATKYIVELEIESYGTPTNFGEIMLRDGKSRTRRKLRAIKKWIGRSISHKESSEQYNTITM